MKFKILLAVFLFLAPIGAFAATRSLSIGDSGSDVTTLQKALIAKEYLAAGKDTGYFGPLTEAAIKKFQCDKKIICSGASVSGYGVYGPRTQAALGSSPVYTTNPSTVSLDKLTPKATGAFETGGWIPYWRAATGTRDAQPHFSQLTTVMPFAYSVRSDGTLSDTLNINEEPWKSFIASAKAAKVRVIPSIMWGNGDSIHRILSNSATRIALEDEIAKVVKDNGFDGIDIDFEAKKHETINYFSTFLKGLYQRMGDKWVYCTVEARMPLENRYLPGQTIPPDATDRANDYVEMAKYCDRVEIMAYDQGTIDQRFNAARPAPYAPVADPGWVENLVLLAAQTIPRNKLLIGIPTYGYEYTVTPLASGGYQYQVLWPFNPGYATDIATRLGITPTRNSGGELGFTYDPARLPPAPTEGNSTATQQHALASTSVAQNPSSQVDSSKPFNFVTWSDAQAIADKVALAKRLGVRGIAIFKIDGGEDPGMWNVIPRVR